MAHVAPEKPSARTTNEVIVGTTGAHTDDIGSAAADDFVIAVQRARFSYTDRNIQDTTASTDGVVQHDISGYIWGQCALQGYMRAGTAIGIKHMVNDTNNDLSFEFYLGGTQYLQVIGRIRDIEVTWGKTSAIVGVMMSIVYSNQTLADLENNDDV